MKKNYPRKDFELLSFDDFDIDKLFSCKDYQFTDISMQGIANELESLYQEFERKADVFSSYPISDEEIQYYDTLLEKLLTISNSLKIKLAKNPDEYTTYTYLHDSFHHVANEIYRMDK